MKVVLVASTGGAVADAVLAVPSFRQHAHSLVTDRECGALDVARRHDLPTETFAGASSAAFCDSLHQYLDRVEADYVVLFYTRLIVGDVVTAYRHRIINLHTSLLPSFKGLDGFGETMASSARFAGGTIHFIDEEMDAGQYILQSSFPLDRSQPVDRLRHRLFEQHCRGLVQVVAWLAEDRVRVVGDHVAVEGAAYTDHEFSPNLDDPDALALVVPFPGELP